MRDFLAVFNSGELRHVHAPDRQAALDALGQPGDAVELHDRGPVEMVCAICGAEDETVQFTYLSETWNDKWQTLLPNADEDAICESPVCAACRSRAVEWDEERARKRGMAIQEEIAEMLSRLAFSDTERDAFWRALAIMEVDEAVDHAMFVGGRIAPEDAAS